MAANGVADVVDADDAQNVAEAFKRADAAPLQPRRRERVLRDRFHIVESQSGPPQVASTADSDEASQPNPEPPIPAPSGPPAPASGADVSPTPPVKSARQQLEEMETDSGHHWGAMRLRIEAASDPNADERCPTYQLRYHSTNMMPECYGLNAPSGSGFAQIAFDTC